MLCGCAWNLSGARVVQPKPVPSSTAGRNHVRRGSFRHTLRVKLQCPSAHPGADDTPSTTSSSGHTETGEPLLSIGQLAGRLARIKVLEDYKAELEKPETPDTLLRCAILIARHKYPDYNEAKVYELLDDMARRVNSQLPEARYPLKVLQVINQVMYRDFGFRGNSEDYYNEQNSLINKVIERRVGIPISLSLVYMEVARRVGLPMVGINLPLHFMIKPAREDIEVLVDAFKGEICYVQDAEEKLSDLMGARVQIDPKFVQGNTPLPVRKFLYRMLTNLRAVYFTTQQVEHALTIVQYMRATDGEPPILLRDEGLCYFALKRYPECLEALKEYLRVETKLPEEERHTMVQVMDEARKRMTVKQD